MTKLKVVVADADREFCNELKAFFQDDERIELLACASDGEQALEIGADTLGYLDLNSLHELVGSKEYCHGCFSGAYPVRVENGNGSER